MKFFSGIYAGISAVMLLTTLSGCGVASHRQYEVVAPQAFPVLTATGMAPISLQLGRTEQEKQRQAMRAATLDAYRELVEQVHGLNVSVASQLEEQQLKPQQLSADASGTIRGAKVVRSYPLGDTYITELELDYQTLWQLQQQRQPRTTLKSVSYY
ncbi:LPP20 family lipoprotein [Ferrimonas senticii]|uniref:LPP20 family lipoprotein n=1 Tax=Ferrimonas senticii TaxID=394566 RepID=UPI000687A493|nr:LPP20 family lipoprotein [Ferrimonas senticii]